MKLEWQRQTVHARHRFATSRGAIDEKESIVVRIEHDGVTGFGDVVPSELYGQTLASSEAALEGIRARLGDDPFQIDPNVGRMIAAHDAQRAAIAGVDAALHDWAGKRLGVPAWRLLGLAPPRVRTAFTIGVAELDEIATKLDEALSAGYDRLKIKVGTDRDHEVLTLIRERFAGDLLLDANTAWTADEAPERIRALAPFEPLVIEQPLRREDWPHMAGLRSLGVAPIIADESCERPADVVKLHGVVDGVNIKLTKCGGIREALKMIALARGLGMRVMLGCFLSSSLAIAPAVAIASLVDFVDLDGHLLLSDDPYDGLTNSGSQLTVGDRPGLGVALRS